MEELENESLRPVKKGKFEKKPQGNLDISSFFAPKK
jgi:hypothetical protein